MYVRAHLLKLAAALGGTKENLSICRINGKDGKAGVCCWHRTSGCHVNTGLCQPCQGPQATVNSIPWTGQLKSRQETGEREGERHAAKDHRWNRTQVRCGEDATSVYVEPALLTEPPGAPTAKISALNQPIRSGCLEVFIKYTVT